MEIRSMSFGHMWAMGHTDVHGSNLEALGNGHQEGSDKYSA